MTEHVIHRDDGLRRFIVSSHSPESGLKHAYGPGQMLYLKPTWEAQEEDVKTSSHLNSDAVRATLYSDSISLWADSLRNVSTCHALLQNLEMCNLARN